MTKMFYDSDVFVEEGKTYNLNYDKKEKNMALEGYNVNDVITIKAVPTFEITYKYDSGFGIYDCELVIDNSDEIPDTFLLKGKFISPLDIGQTFEIKGEIKEYKEKKQLEVLNIKKVKPSNKRGIISFLQSLRGVGHFAEVIYEEFGDESINVIKNEPKKILSLSPALYMDLILDWRKQISEIKDDQEVLSVLMGYGLNMKNSRILFEKYKESIVTKISENPYFLAKEIKGYSFLKCDKIAKIVGFSPKSSHRIQECIMHILNEIQYEGHVYLPKEELIERSIKLLSVRMTYLEMKKAFNDYKYSPTFKYKYGNISYEIPYSDLVDAYVSYENSYSKKDKENSRLLVVDFNREEIEKEFNILKLENRIVEIDDKIYTTEMFKAEESLSYNILKIIENEKVLNEDLETQLDNYLKENNITLERKQKEAVLVASKSLGGFTIINGSAGCGKTFTLNIALKFIEKQYIKNNNFFEVLILAPTGKASKVASKATGRNAMTVHRALRYNPNTGFYYNAKNKLPVDCIVLDESSMLDLELANHLFNALPHTAKVIFLGDTKQLPSVGAGNILKDLIDSNVVHIVTLDVVKRQGKDSGIVKNANKIINKEMITTEKETKDAYVFGSKGEEDAVEKIINLFGKLSGIYTIDEVQVLCPQRNGIIGVNYLNYLLQQRYNQRESKFQFLNKEISIKLPNESKSSKLLLYFKEGDKVINMKNNYSMPCYRLDGKRLVLDPDNVGVTNGECGRIIKTMRGKDINGNEVDKIIVKYEDKIVIYEDDFSELDHSYAMTIHKSQGSEWKAVIIPILMCNYNMLDNNLFYTAYTRAKEFNATICTVDALEHAIKTYKSTRRYTTLNEQLKMMA